MLFNVNTLISFLLLALTPFFAFAQDSSSSTTTVSTTITSTMTAYVTMTGTPPSSTSAVNGTIVTPTPSSEAFPGAAAGTFHVSYGLGAGVLGAIIFGML